MKTEQPRSNGVQCPVWALYLFVFLAIVVALNFVSKLFTETGLRSTIL